jgi:hypothetical protein
VPRECKGLPPLQIISTVLTPEVSTPNYTVLTWEGEKSILMQVDKGAEEEHTHAVQKAPPAPDYIVLTREGSAQDY